VAPAGVALTTATRAIDVTWGGSFGNVSFGIRPTA
jgi:hypothetical protein